MLSKIVELISKKPSEIIEGIICFLALYTGLHALSPWFEYSSTALVTSSITSGPAIIIYATILIGLGSVGLYSLARLKWPTRMKARRVVTFLMFIILIWFTVMRLATFGLAEVTWVPTLALALISGVLYIRLPWDNRPWK